MLTARCLAVLFVFLTTTAFGQDTGVRGSWQTPGGAVLRVADCGPRLCITILKLEPNSPYQFDSKNPDANRRGNKLCGLAIGYDFQLTDPSHAEDGRVYDPKSGKTYHGSMSSSGDQLSLRGYVGIKALGRSETWKRTEAPLKPCS